MAERNDLTAVAGNGGQRSADEIRSHIAADRLVLTETVDQIGELIHDKLDWRGYVQRSPYLALGAAAGAGFMAAGIFKQRQTPLERIMDRATGALGRASGQGLIRMTLYGIATKLAVHWIQKAVSEEFLKEDSERNLSREPPGPSDYWEPRGSVKGNQEVRQPL